MKKKQKSVLQRACKEECILADMTLKCFTEARKEVLKRLFEVTHRIYEEEMKSRD